MTRVKICGCRAAEQALAAKEAGADFVGMIFAESRRKVMPSVASEIVQAVREGEPIDSTEPGGPIDDLLGWFAAGACLLSEGLTRRRPLTVGVFANNHPKEIEEIERTCGIDLVQLSGGEDWKLNLEISRPVVKVLHVEPQDGAESLRGRVEAGSAVALMLDSGGSDAKGGTGKSFRWDLARDLAADMPIWLAGGLTPDNVSSAVKQIRPWCVDVSSGVETDGIKDPEKIRAFVQAAKGTRT